MLAVTLSSNTHVYKDSQPRIDLFIVIRESDVAYGNLRK